MTNGGLYNRRNRRNTNRAFRNTIRNIASLPHPYLAGVESVPLRHNSWLFACLKVGQSSGFDVWQYVRRRHHIILG